MKKTLMAGALFLCAGLVSAQAPPPSSQVPPPDQPSARTDDKDKDAAKGEKHKMKAEVVSTNADAKTITVKNLAMDTGAAMSEPSSGEVTLKLDSKASDRIASLKAGDKVTLTCKGDTAATTASQHCQTVTDINKSGY
jgi:hypothetical protein